jgi:hypothetical protein
MDQSRIEILEMRWVPLVSHDNTLYIDELGDKAVVLPVAYALNMF